MSSTESMHPRPPSPVYVNMPASLNYPCNLPVMNLYPNAALPATNLNAVPAAHLYTNAVPAMNLYANAVPAMNLYANAVPAVNLYTNALPSTNHNVVPAMNHYANAVPATNIYANGLPATNLNAVPSASHTNGVLSASYTNAGPNTNLYANPVPTMNFYANAVPSMNLYTNPPPATNLNAMPASSPMNELPAPNLNTVPAMNLYANALPTPSYGRELLAPNNNAAPTASYGREEPVGWNYSAYRQWWPNGKLPRPQAIYRNVNDVPLASDVYGNGAAWPPPEIPLYENWPLGANNGCPQIPTNASYSEPHQRAVIQENDLVRYSFSDSQTSNVHESGDVVRPSSVLLPTYSTNGLVQNMTAQENGLEMVPSTDLAILASVKVKKENYDKNCSFVNWFCSVCNNQFREEGLECAAVDETVYVRCFACIKCRDQLERKQMYCLKALLFCEESYVINLEKCFVCQKQILSRMLRANGRQYHSHCFNCVICFTSLDGKPFTVDPQNRIYCIDDFHKTFAPRCCVCKFPIIPENGQNHAERYVAFDRSFHVQCYRCEICYALLGSEDEGRRGCCPLNGQVLCKSCNAKTVQILNLKLAN